MLLVAHYFGVGPDLDGYYLALVLPTFLVGVVGGAAQTGFFPVHARLRAQGQDELARDLQSAFFWMLLVVSLIVSTVMAAGSGWITSWLSGGASARVVEAATFSLRIVGFVFVLNTVVDFLGFVLAAHLRFGLTAVAPAANAMTGAVFLYALPELGLYNLVWGTVLGICVQLVILTLGMLSAGVRIVAPWNLSSGSARSVREAAQLGIWILPGMFFANLSAALPQVLAADFGEGAISALGYALRLHSAAVQLLVMSLSTVLLAKFSQQVAGGKEKDLAESLARGLQLVLGIGSLLLLWVWAAGPGILRLLFQHGVFDYSAASQVADLWFWLALGLGPMIWGIILAKVFQAWRRPKFITLLAAGGLFVLWGAARLLSGRYSVAGIALAASISGCTITACYHFELLRVLRKKSVWFPFSWKRLSVPLSAFVAALGAVVGMQALEQSWEALHIAIVTLVVVGGVYLVYSRVGSTMNTLYGKA